VKVQIVLIIPEYGCETAKVYDAFDALGCTSDDEIANDLLLPACEVEKQLATDIDTLRTLFELEVHLSGSGSSMFIICDNAQQATALTRDIEKQTNHVALATQTYTPQGAMERT
jgi:4-diphosphocytidyl-2C-methyl-D-erythritol kinase